MTVLTGESTHQVVESYNKALVLEGSNKASMQLILAQLRLLDRLNFRPEQVEAAMDVLQEEFFRWYGVVEVDAKAPLRVFVFSGDTIDQPSRTPPRFPPDMEDVVRQSIKRKLEELEAGLNDLAITAGAANGGDILFIEECLKCKMKVEVYLPFEIPRYIKESVSLASSEWSRRFYRIHKNPNVTFHFQPDRLGPVPERENVYERNNRWALYSARGFGIEQMEMIVLWDGQPSDLPGGTSHMVKEMIRIGGAVEYLDTTAMFFEEEKELLDPLIATTEDTLVRSVRTHRAKMSENNLPDDPIESGGSLNTTRSTIFISYSHKDEFEKELLLSHLRVLRSAGLTDVWNDDRIAAGSEWKVEIELAIDRSAIAILLISANFLTSDFILKNEVPRLLKIHKQGGATIFPVIAKPCAWRTVDWLSEMNVRPKNGEPVWGDAGQHVDKDLAKIAEEIADILNEEKERK